MIIINCPAREDILNYEIDSNGNLFITGIDTANYCVKHKKLCKDIADCIIKQHIKGNKVNWGIENEKQ